jgi:hypothetical protein
MLEPLTSPGPAETPARPFPWFCPNCRRQEVRRATIPYQCERLHEGQPTTVVLENFSVPRCDNCGELVFDYEAEEQINRAFEDQASAGSKEQAWERNRLFTPEGAFVGRIHDQLAYSASIKNPAFPSVQLLSREQLSVLIETAFWASLRSNEGRSTRVSLAVVAPDNYRDALEFAAPISYDESQIAKLAPAVPPGGWLAVSGASDALKIWGFGRSRPGSWLGTVTIKVWGPGSLGVGLGPFQTFLVANGKSNLSIEGTGNELAHYLQRALQKPLPVADFRATQAVWWECLALADLARMVLDESHGGIVLIVPKEAGTWEESLKPFDFRFAPPDRTIGDAIRLQLDEQETQGKMLLDVLASQLTDEVKNQVARMCSQQHWAAWKVAARAIASLAAVDGAIVTTRDLQVLGFGAKIVGGNGAEIPVCIGQAMPGIQQLVSSSLEQCGGTRHQSAVRFAAANRDAVALVISQDRHLSIVHWNEESNSVVLLRHAEWWL